MNSLQKFLNTKLNSYISHAKLEGKDGGRVFVRVLSTTKKILEVKPLMKKWCVLYYLVNYLITNYLF